MQRLLQLADNLRSFELDYCSDSLKDSELLSKQQVQDHPSQLLACSVVSGFARDIMLSVQFDAAPAHQHY